MEPRTEQTADGEGARQPTENTLNIPDTAPCESNTCSQGPSNVGAATRSPRPAADAGGEGGAPPLQQVELRVGAATGVELGAGAATWGAGEATGVPPVADDLASKGFTLRQLLCFYRDKKITRQKTTAEVVREIVIPDTADRQTCYMLSDYMQESGGPRRARKLVSHAWKSSFMTTVLNITMDASGLAAFELKKEGLLGMNQEIDVEKALAMLSDAALASTYWLCIFAVNEHRCICGACWSCHPSTPEELRAPRCRCSEECSCGQKGDCGQCWTAWGAGKKKFNPCGCGSLKYPKDDPLYEIDKFDAVVGLMDGLVVSLDSDLETLKRLWVVAEIDEAVRSKPVYFRCFFGLSGPVVAKLKQYDAKDTVVPAVSDCEVASEEDKARILGKIDATPGGRDAFDTFVWTMVEISFGVFHRLPDLTGMGLSTIAKMRQLEVDLSWAVRSFASLEGLGWANSSWGVLKHLQGLTLDFRPPTGFRRPQFTDVSAVAVGLRELTNLLSLNMDFDHCSKLGDVSPIGSALQELKGLESLGVSFCFCGQLKDISPIGAGLRGLKGLRSLRVDVSHSDGIKEVSPLALGLQECRGLQSFDMRLSSCRQLRGADIAAVGSSLRELRSLQTLRLKFAMCLQLNDISTIGSSLKELRCLERLSLNFIGCLGIADASCIGAGLHELKSLQSLSLEFNGCFRIGDASAIGAGLRELRNLQSLNLNLSGCSGIKDVSSIGSGLRELKVLRSLSLDFHGCFNVEDVSSIGSGLEGLEGLRSLSLDLTGCLGLWEGLARKFEDVESVRRAFEEEPAGCCCALQ